LGGLGGLWLGGEEDEKEARVEVRFTRKGCLQTETGFPYALTRVKDLPYRRRTKRVGLLLNHNSFFSFVVLRKEQIFSSIGVRLETVGRRAREWFGWLAWFGAGPGFEEKQAISTPLISMEQEERMCSLLSTTKSFTPIALKTGSKERGGGIGFVTVEEREEDEREEEEGGTG